MSHTSSDSSLLQRARPLSLPPQPMSPTTEVAHTTQQQRLHLETHESRHIPEAFVVARSRSRSRANSHSRTRSSAELFSLYSSTSTLCSSPQQTSPSIMASHDHAYIYTEVDVPAQPVASTSSGMGYLNAISGPSASTDSAQPAEFSYSPDQAQHCTATLTAMRDGAVGHEMSRDHWQPDSSSALCSFPFCTTMFVAPSASYFALGPRRHHCRKCGLLFCSAHSSSRAMLYAIDADTHLVKSRVCDTCIGKSDSSDPDPASRNPTQTHSRRHSTASSEDATDSNGSGSRISTEGIVTPHSDFALSRSSTRGAVPTTPGGSGLASPGTSGILAPVEGWMDKAGVLSLYPLALPSDSRKSALPAAGPLFAPSLAAIRNAKEKEEQAVLTVRQRRLGRESEPPLQWSVVAAAAEKSRSRRGSMESVQEEEGQELKWRFGWTNRIASQERITQSTF